jgi:NADH dehydrogenase
LAPVAIQQGRCAAQNIARTVAGKERAAFRYNDRGTMATIGRAAGIAQLRSLKLSGFLGWVAWLFIHLLFLIGFRNRLLVMMQWMWSYVTYQRGARLITGFPPREVPADGVPSPRIVGDAARGRVEQPSISK